MGELSKAIPNEDTLRVDVEIKLNDGLTRGIEGVRVTIKSMQTEE